MGASPKQIAKGILTDLVFKIVGSHQPARSSLIDGPFEEYASGGRPLGKLLNKISHRICISRIKKGADVIDPLISGNLRP
jgi:hypothetical protein